MSDGPGKPGEVPEVLTFCSPRTWMCTCPGSAGSDFVSYQEPGTLPEASELRALEDLVQGSAARIVDDYLAHRADERVTAAVNRELERRDYDLLEVNDLREYRVRVLGAGLALILGCGGLLVVGIAVWLGQSVVGAVGVVGIIAVLVAVVRTREPPLKRLAEITRAIREETEANEDA